MKVKAVKVNRAHYFLTDPRIIDNMIHQTASNNLTSNNLEVFLLSSRRVSTMLIIFCMNPDHEVQPCQNREKKHTELTYLQGASKK